MREIDLAPETDHDAIARRALAIVSDIRDVDPALTRDTLTIMCGTEPTRMAQVLMCLAAWVDPEQSTAALGMRADLLGRAVA